MRRMCGRFKLAKAPAEVQKLFQLYTLLDFLQPLYNIAPFQQVPAATLNADGITRQLRMYRWGLTRSWATDAKTNPRPINARSEGIAKKPMFSQLLKSNRRCLFVADGFFEWMRDQPGKHPNYFHFRDSRSFAMAGLWDAWGSEEPVYSACILTTEANEVVRPLHDRMPVILSPDDHEAWLSPDSKVEDILPLLRPLTSEGFEGFEVRTLVNKVANAGPELIEPLSSV